jgi:hypothetical protein
MSPLTKLIITAGVVTVGYALAIRYDVQGKIAVIRDNIKKLRHRVDSRSFMKVITFVPKDYAGLVRDAAHKAGAGHRGNYRGMSFSSEGTGRFVPEDGARPLSGQIGAPEAVLEERIELITTRAEVEKVVGAIRKAHPYEEVPVDVYQLEEI